MNPNPPSILAALRSQGTSTAIGAALLLYFGFMQLDFSTGAGLFETSANVFIYTLRIGGIALMAMALFLWAGWRPALLLDGLASIPIGILMVLCSVGMMAGGGGFGLNNVIILFCGVMFVSSGRNSLRLRRAIAAPGGKTLFVTSPVVDEHRSFARPPGHVESTSGSADQSPQLAHPFASAGQAPENAPPEGGYLAAFGRKSSDPGRGDHS